MLAVTTPSGTPENDGPADVDGGPGDPVPAAAAPRSRTAPRWLLPLLLVATAALYLVDLDVSGYGNDFYAAAAQAGSQSWKAFFYGASDAGSSITVDKPPASLWVMALSIRLFGLNPWSVMGPQVLMGVASVALLHATVRRAFGDWAGLLAGLVLALTPVAVLMFRFDNPDALLVLCSVAAAWALLRGVADGRTRWLLLAGALLGLGFLAKQLQVALVVPPLALTYLLAGPVRLRRRLGQLLLGGLTAVLAGGWWVAIVSLVPPADRPYVGGTSDDSVLSLTLGYNGLGRLTGREALGNGVTRDRTSFTYGGSHGLQRLLTGTSGGEIGWFAPTALVLGLLALLITLKAPRTDPRRAQLLLWTLWLATTAAVFGGMSGIYHDYYTVALAPPVAALVAAGGAVLWARRARWWGSLLLAAAVAGTAAWGYVLLERSRGLPDALRWVVAGGGGLLTLVLLLRRPRTRGPSGAVLAVAVAAFALVGPTAWSVTTVAASHAGSSPTAGPHPGLSAAASRLSTARGAVPDGVVALLRADAGSYTWVAATNGSEQAARYQLAAGGAVASVGGFTGLDPSPTLVELEGWVREHRVHYYIGGGLAGLLGGGSNVATSAQISSWVGSHYTSRTVDGVTLYDLSVAPKP